MCVYGGKGQGNIYTKRREKKGKETTGRRREEQKEVKHTLMGLLSLYILPTLTYRMQQQQQQQRRDKHGPNVPPMSRWNKL